MASESPSHTLLLSIIEFHTNQLRKELSVWEAKGHDRDLEYVLVKERVTVLSKEVERLKELLPESNSSETVEPYKVFLGFVKDILLSLISAFSGIVIAVSTGLLDLFKD